MAHDDVEVFVFGFVFFVEDPISELLVGLLLQVCEVLHAFDDHRGDLFRQRSDRLAHVYGVHEVVVFFQGADEEDVPVEVFDEARVAVFDDVLGQLQRLVSGEYLDDFPPLLFRRLELLDEVVVDRRVVFSTVSRDYSL